MLRICCSAEQDTQSAMKADRLVTLAVMQACNVEAMKSASSSISRLPQIPAYLDSGGLSSLKESGKA